MLPRSSVIQETRMFDSEPLKRTQIEDNASSCIKRSYLRNVHVNAAILGNTKKFRPARKIQKTGMVPPEGLDSGTPLSSRSRHKSWQACPERMRILAPLDRALLHAMLLRRRSHAVAWFPARGEERERRAAHDTKV